MSNVNKATYKQDMPPPGGYKNIQIGRVPTWSPNSKYFIAAFAVFTPIAYWHFKYRTNRAMRLYMEEDEGRTALQPLLEAEQDRLLLWQMRRNRDEENNLMKDVPGWVTGTWFGEPIFKSNPNYDDWLDPGWSEIYPHTRLRDLKRQMFFKQSYA